MSTPLVNQAVRYPHGSLPVSVLILTLNEEKNLGACIASVSWSDDIVVLDSGSADRTCELARHMGCRVIRRQFDNWSAHQNWALQNITFKNRWVLNVDADERVSEQLSAEMGEAIRAENCAAFRFRRRDHFRGVWLKHATFYPTWLIRLYRADCVHFERLVNPVTSVRGDVRSLVGHLEHYPFSKGIAHWIERHNSYSTFEAAEYRRRLPIESSVVSRDANRRRAALKTMFMRIPLRPVVKFVYLYVLHLGFLDGRAGLDYCILQSIYEYFISLKLRDDQG